MLKNALQPVLLDCRVTWDLPKGYSAESVPDPLPSIFSGESLVLYGFLSFSSAKKKPSVEKELVGSMKFTATLTSPSGNKSVKHKISLEGLSSESAESKLLHRLAAKASIQAKQYQEEEEGAFTRDEEKERIIRLSKSANVISKLTSFVAVDKESHEPVSRPMTRPRRSEECLLMSAAPRCGTAQLAPGSAIGRLFTARKSAMVYNSLLYRADSVDSDEDADAFVRKTPKTPWQRSKGSDFLHLVSLQRASGSWQLTAQLANICGLTMDKLKKDCPPDLTADKESVWATALALSCLFCRFKDKRDEWEMVAAKGTKWLKKTINNKTLSCDKLMEMAANTLANAED